MTARSGSFCAPEGATASSTRGVTMICSPNTGGRNRWSSSGGPTDRRKLLTRARKAGVKVRRNQPAEEIEQMITDALEEAGQPPVVTRLEPPAPGLAITPGERIVERLAAVGGSEKLLPLGEIHAGLPELSAEQFRAEVLRMHRENILVLEDDPLPWRVTDADRAVGVRMGGATLTLAILLPTGTDPGTDPESDPESDDDAAAKRSASAKEAAATRRRKKEYAEQDDRARREHFAPGGPHARGDCGPVCTRFDY